ncbi:hypothetical protein YC2023_078320 [Brassica napus]
MVSGESVHISMKIPTNQRTSFSLVVTHILTATTNYFLRALNPQHNLIVVLLPLPLYNLMNPLSIQAQLLRFSTQTDRNNGFQSTKRQIVPPLTLLPLNEECIFENVSLVVVKMKSGSMKVVNI